MNKLKQNFNEIKQNWNFYVFTKNPEKSEELCKEAFKKFPNYQWKSYIDEDREWDFYFNFIYPDVYSYHAIMNRSVIENLTISSKKSSTSISGRWIAFFLFFIRYYSILKMIKIREWI